MNQRTPPPTRSQVPARREEPKAELTTADKAAALFPWSGLSGKLEPGEPADFVVLDRDPRSAPVEDVRSTKVLATYVAGREVYRAGGEAG